MIEFVQNNKRENVILFIHGFTGGKETWKNVEYGYFFDQLLAVDGIAANFDVATFEYFTKLTSIFADVDTVVGRLKSLFKNIQPKAKKNISVEEISELLKTRIRFDLAPYRNVIIVAHSMGGLVAKSCVLKDLQQGLTSKVKMILSFAVPHLGADLATYGKLLSNNKQLNDLAPLSELCPAMNDEWVKYSIKPVIKYFYGTYDGIVNKNSAVGTDNIVQDIIACDDDHLSIVKPNGSTSVAVTAATHFLAEFLHSQPTGSTLAAKKLDSPTQYDDEVFVLKLLLADVHNATVKHSKEHFLNAEYARKLFSSSADQEKLRVLYDKIRTLYQNCYGSHGGTTSSNSTLLVNAVHQKIISEDAGYLKTALPLLQGLHKLGMLHQLANDLKDDIWWGENQSIESIDALKLELDKK
jgi:hypothetical protein